MPTAGDPSTILVEWSAPTTINGDDILGYRVYIDNGRGGPFSLVYDGEMFPSTYSYLAGEIESLDCGYLYMIRVTALNVAGEGDHISGSTHLGNVPSNPKSPYWLTITP